jgi:hypothetical protein
MHESNLFFANIFAGGGEGGVKKSPETESINELFE